MGFYDETRKAWTTRAVTKPPVVPGDYKGMAVHWPGEKIAYTKQEHPFCLAALKRIEEYHVGSKGYANIAYQVVVCPHGHVIEGRGLVTNGANGNTEANTKYGSILFLVGIGETPTPPQYAAALRVREVLVPGKPLLTHNEVRVAAGVGATGCPGPEITAWIKAGLPIVSGTIVVPPKPPTAKPAPSAKPTIKQRIKNLVSNKPTIDLSVVRAQALAPKPRFALHVRIVQQLLVQEGLLSKASFQTGPGYFGPKTKVAYQKWQQRCGYRGKDADGIPGEISLKKLLSKYGYKLVK